MLNVVVSGNLAADVEPSKNPDWLKVRLGSNSAKKNKDGGYDKITTWCNGVVNAKQVSGILNRLVKGAYVVAAVSDASIDMFNGRDGQPKASLALGIIRTLEVGKSPADGAPGAAAAAPQQAPVQQQFQQPLRQQQPQYQQQNSFTPF